MAQHAHRQVGAESEAPRNRRQGHEQALSAQRLVVKMHGKQLQADQREAVRPGDIYDRPIINFASN